MKPKKQLVDRLDEVYDPDMCPEKLAAKAACPKWQAYLYLAERAFRDEAISLREGGYSLRKIAREMDANHMTVFHRLNEENEKNVD